MLCTAYLASCKHVASHVGEWCGCTLQGLKRERREAAGEAKARKKTKAAQPAEDAADGEVDE
jgi:hypothetical protein